MSATWLIAIVVGAVLAAVAVWQRRIERAGSRRVRAQLAEARERGTHAPLTQHPVIEPLLCIGCTTCVEACPEHDVLGMVRGVATVIHGSRCIGIALCAEACPVGAITVGLGELANSPDMPKLDDELETSVPGIFIAGELGGYALIRNAVAQGTQALSAVGRSAHLERAKGDASVEDVLIVGAGPAGLAATLRAVELGLRYRTIDMDDIGGTVRKYPRRKLTLTQPVDLPLVGRAIERHEYLKEELIELFERIVADYELRIDSGVKLEAVSRDADGVLTAGTSAGEIRCRTIVLALGRRGTPRRLGVPGEAAEKVLYQLMDAASYRDEHVLVVGGGDSAIEAACALAEQPGNVVTLSYRKPHFFRVKPKNEQRIGELVAAGRIRLVMSSNVARIEADHVVLRVTADAAKGEEEIPNGAVFVFAGGVPPFPLLKSMGIEMGAPAGSSIGSAVRIEGAEVRTDTKSAIHRVPTRSARAPRRPRATSGRAPRGGSRR